MGTRVGRSKAEREGEGQQRETVGDQKESLVRRSVGIRHPCGRKESVCAVVKHFLSESFEHRLGLHVQVAEHGGAMPTAKQLDGIVIATAAQ